jgi:phosphohistidine phosphatase
MKLLLLRHGIAVDPGTPGYERDSERPLTTEGQRKVRLVARALGRLELMPNVILTSPLLRARQTASVVAEILERTRQLHDCPPLTQGGPPAAVLTFLKKHHARAGCVMLVGHQPDLGCLASLLITGNPHGAQIEFKKAGLGVLEWGGSASGGDAILQLLATPKMLTRIE